MQRIPWSYKQIRVDRSRAVYGPTIGLRLHNILQHPHIHHIDFTTPWVHHTIVGNFVEVVTETVDFGLVDWFSRS